MDPITELIRAEEAKRDRNWNSVARHKAIMAAIEWVDRQQAVPRNSRQGCLEKQQHLLEQLAQWQARQQSPPESSGSRSS